MLLKAYGNSEKIVFPLIEKDSADFNATPATFAAGDALISQDGGSYSNTTNLPAHVGNGVYSLLLTAAEMTAANIRVVIIDQTSPKTWEDQSVEIETFGHANAALAFSFSSGVRVSSQDTVSYTV